MNEPKDDIHLTWGRWCMKDSTVPGCEIKVFATKNKFSVRETHERSFKSWIKAKHEHENEREPTWKVFKS